MSISRFDINNSEDRLMFVNGIGHLIGLPTRPGTSSAATTGVPTNGIQGFAPGALFINYKASSVPAVYTNIGTFASALWELIATSAGSDTFTNLYVTDTLHGGPTGLRINAANTGAGDVSIGSASDSVYLGSSTPFGGNDTSRLGGGAPLADDTTGTVAGAGTAMSISFNSTGGIGSSSYTFTNLIYTLKSKGILFP